MKIKAILFVFSILFLLSYFVSANEMSSPYDREFEEAYKEKEYAFKLVPKFHTVLVKKGYVPGINFNFIRWKYKREIQRHPDNPFLPFCMGELHRFKGRYKEASEYYDGAIEHAGDNVFKHMILLELFSQRRLLKWQMKQEETLLELRKNYGALSFPLLSTYFFVRGYEAVDRGLKVDEEKEMLISKELNPYDLAIRFHYARYLLLERRFDFFDELLSTIHIMLVDFHTRLVCIIFSYNFLFLFLSIIISVLVIAYFIRYFAYMVSKITSFFPHKLPIAKRHFLAITAILLPIIWTFPSLYTFVFLLIVPISFLERRERWLIQFFIILLCVLSIGGVFQTKAVTTMDPLNRVALLDIIQKSRYESRWVTKCDSFLALSSRDFAAYYLKGLQLKRGGKYDEAEMNYRNAIYIEPRIYQTYNNMGNVLFWKEEVDSAIKYYELAIDLEGDAAAPHFNLAQAYVRKLLFEKSSRHMKTSSNLDFYLIIDQTKNMIEINNRFLIDLTLPEQVLWVEFLSLKEENNVFPWKFIGFDYRIVVFILFGCFLLYLIIPRIVKDMKDECPVCSSPISKGSVRLLENEAICWRCHRKLSSIHSLDIQERLRDKIRLDTQNRVGYTSVFWGLFIPGLGHLQAGKTRVGCIYLAIFSFLISLLVFKRITEIGSYLPFIKGVNVGLYSIIAIIAFLYLFSLLALFGGGYEKRK